MIVANLVNELESNINSENIIGTKSTEYELKPVHEERKYNLEVFLLALALFMVIFEVFFIKWRGDL